MDNKIICVVGRTCSGKDTLVQKLIDLFPLDFVPFISYTDRPMRMSETNGKEHWFMTKEGFTKMMEETKPLAYTQIKSKENPDGYRYMCTEDQVGKCNLYVIDPKGIYYILNNFDNIDLRIIYVMADEEVREERAKSRSDYTTEYKKRCEQEDEQFSKFEEIAIAGELELDRNFFIVHNNDSIDRTFAHFAHAALNAVDDDTSISNEELYSFFMQYIDV